MLYRELLTQELNEKREEFARFVAEQSDTLEEYLGLLQKLAASSDSEVRKAVGDKDVGALTSDELDKIGNVSQKFEPRWRSHEEARKWATQILQNRVTFAADGSQLLFEREVSMRVGAVQIGTFENPHSADQNYRKQADFKLITPQIFDDAEREFEKPFNAETVIAYERFCAEVEAAKKFLDSKKGWRERGERMPLAFFDGTLLISISMPRTSLQSRFVEKMAQLARISRETRVPLVGYIDQSFAHDLIGLLDYLYRRFTSSDERRTLTDAQLLNFGTLHNWGDRSAFFYCQRRGLSDYFNTESGTGVGFVYLQTTSDSTAARLDIPGWIYEAGLLEEVLDTVRAECIIGLGYPYPLETADATAVITMRDRETFLRALQDFSSRENLNFRITHKKISKARRR
jgi:hypothetical protein